MAKIELHKEYWSLRLHKTVEVIEINGDIITIIDENDVVTETTAKTLVEMEDA